jgi:biotin synthase
MAQLKAAGLYRNNHNLEASKGYFENVCTTHSYEQRTNHVQMTQHYGIHPCSGGILGMGESAKDRIDLAFELKKLKAHCVPINILNPRPGTPLGNVKTLEPIEIIKYIALYRLILPSATIKIAGGREVNLRDMQAMAMQAGANGLVIGNYLTTMGRNPGQDLQMLKDLGFAIQRPSTKPEPAGCLSAC